MKVVKEGEKIVAYRHWFKWYFSAYMVVQFQPERTRAAKGAEG